MNIQTVFNKIDLTNVNGGEQVTEWTWKRIVRPALVPGAAGFLSGYTGEKANVLVVQRIGERWNHARIITPLTVWRSEAPKVSLSKDCDVAVSGWFRAYKQQGLFRADGEAVLLYEDVSDNNKPKWKQTALTLSGVKVGEVAAVVGGPPPDATSWPTAWLGLSV